MPQTVMSHDFSRVPEAEIPRSSFDRTHGHKTTFDAGILIPIYVDDVLPGDTFSMSMTGFCRLATPLHPFMDNVFLNSFFFFVPNRLIWDNWERMNGAQRNPADSTDFLVPQITAPAGGFTAGSIYDYMGVPLGIAGLKINALHLRAYNLIYNEWFRDENLINSASNPVDDGPDGPTVYALLRRGKRHDYFTSALPWPQKGASVSIPLGNTAPILGLGTTTQTGTANPAGGVFETGRTTKRDFTAARSTSDITVNGPLIYEMTATSGGFPNIRADLSTATAATINQLRQAFQVQKLYERDARGGTRYTEMIKAHFGVTSPDARLQRPEYLGGGQSAVNLHQVEQTSNNASDETPQGNLAAYGTSVMSDHAFSQSFTEHGVIIGLICARADLTYQQGLNRMWSRRTRFDFYMPVLSHLGEQTVLSQEIFADGTAGDTTVFGYQERYAEYRYKPSIITGQMRSSFAQTLDTWHLAQNFASRPLLNGAFIQEDPPIDRVIAVQTEPHFIGDFYFKLRCARPMPVYGVPGLIDHF